MNIDVARLFSKRRIGMDRSDTDSGERSTFERDHDRIVYSNSFRRLHDKTQVFPYSPLSASSQARSRLSHSLEVSCVARSLGNMAGHHMKRFMPAINPYDIGMAVASASLAHDIGNPPFGHSGEDAIRHWSVRNLGSVALNEQERRDLCSFEGNAQGFRILSRLEIWQRTGGIRPACATVGAFSKYPCPSSETIATTISRKKFGFTREDEELFIAAFEEMGVPRHNDAGKAFHRHPLAFLSEAADDICYAVIDLEDSFHLGIIEYHQVEELLMPIAASDADFVFEADHEPDMRVARMRSGAINAMLNQAFEVFTARMEDILTFRYDSSLIAEIANAREYEIIYEFSMRHIYAHPMVQETEYAGFTAINGLLDIFAPAVLSDNPDRAERIARKLIPPISFKRREFIAEYTADETVDSLIRRLSPYSRMLSMTDFISGMTDRYAVDLYQRLRGMKIGS
jgi:dGTPase